MRAHSTCSSAKIVILPAQPVEYTPSDSGRQLSAFDHHAHSGSMGVDGDLEAARNQDRSQGGRTRNSAGLVCEQSPA